LVTLRETFNHNGVVLLFGSFLAHVRPTVKLKNLGVLDYHSN
jgi:hypothetical protein